VDLLRSIRPPSFRARLCLQTQSIRSIMTHVKQPLGAPMQALSHATVRVKRFSRMRPLAWRIWSRATVAVALTVPYRIVNTMRGDDAAERTISSRESQSGDEPAMLQSSHRQVQAVPPRPDYAVAFPYSASARSKRSCVRHGLASSSVGGISEPFPRCVARQYLTVNHPKSGHPNAVNNRRRVTAA